MIVHLLLMCITTVLCFLPKLNSRIRYLDTLRISFFIIWIYISIRYYYGADYLSYEQLYIDVKQGITYGNIERLFTQIMGLFPKFYVFIIFTSTLLCISYYFLIKKYINPKYYWIAMLFLFIQESLILNNLIALRSALCVYIFIYAFRFIISRRIILFFIFIALATMIHTSSIILAPLYFIPYIIGKFKNYGYIFYTTIIVFFTGYLLSTYLFELIMDNNNYFAKYEIYFFNFRKERSLYGLLYFSPFVWLSYLFSKNLKYEYKVEHKIIMFICLYFILITLLQIDIMGRFSMYLWPFFMIGVLNMTKYFKSNLTKVTYLLFIVAYSLMGLITLYSSEHGAHFLNYNTIFEARYLP